MQAYQILWIDDEADALTNFMDEAELHELYITPFKTSREGMAYLEANLETVDAVILDAKVYKDSTEEVARLAGLQNSIREIAKLEGQRKVAIPHVVFTGQPDLVADDDFKEQMDTIKVFSKHTEADELFDHLREAIGDATNAYFRSKYADIHKFCMADPLTENCWKSLLTLLKHVLDEERISIDPYNEIRKCLEGVFRILHKYKILHEHLVSPHVNLQLSSIFLAGKTTKSTPTHPALASKTPIFPGLIAANVKYILEVTQPGSHSEDIETASTSDNSIAYLEKYVPNHHLIQCLVPMLIDVIAWSDAYIKENPCKTTNEANWISTNENAVTCVGTIFQTDRYGNLWVRPEDDADVRENIRIYSNQTGSLSIGNQVRVTSEPIPGKDFRNATSIHPL